jgi:hypothetical protein
MRTKLSNAKRAPAVESVAHPFRLGKEAEAIIVGKLLKTKGRAETKIAAVGKWLKKSNNRGTLP